MHSIQVTKLLTPAPDRVWQTLSGLSNVCHYHPQVEHSESLNGQERGVGARRQCTMYTGERVEELVTAYDESNRTITIEVTDHGPFPLTHMEVTATVHRHRLGSLVELDATFQPKFGPLGWLLAKLVMKRQFRTVLGELLTGLDTHLKTGRIVERNGRIGELAPVDLIAAWA